MRTSCWRCMRAEAMRRSAPSRAKSRWSSRSPARTCTATSVNSAEARESLELAHRLIVLQPKAAEELRAPLRKKVRVVVQSSATTLRHRPVSGKFRICVIGHLREEKDPLRIIAALPHVAPAVEVVHLGAALDPKLKPATDDARYRWLGSVPHGRALRWLASSHAMVISSRMEGGANVVCEALRIGVPVLASRISGNVGLLGASYPGYFPLEDERALARLIARAATDADLYAVVESLCGETAPHGRAAGRGTRPARRAQRLASRTVGRHSKRSMNSWNTRSLSLSAGGMWPCVSLSTRFTPSAPASASSSPR